MTMIPCKKPPDTKEFSQFLPHQEVLEPEYIIQEGNDQNDLFLGTLNFQAPPRLSLTQQGAYFLLCNWYYKNNKPLPNNPVELCKICNAVEQYERAAVQYVLNEFFVLVENGWRKADCCTKTSPIESLFERIWDLYPGKGKNGQLGAAFKGDKKAAKKRFETIYRNTKEIDLETLISNIVKGCRDYSEFLEKSGYPSKHLSTWLNAAGWETDYSVSASSQANSRRGSSYSLEVVYAQAMADQTYRHLRERGSGETTEIGTDAYDL